MRDVAKAEFDETFGISECSNICYARASFSYITTCETNLSISQKGLLMRLSNVFEYKRVLLFCACLRKAVVIDWPVLSQIHADKKNIIMDISTPNLQPL